MLGMVDTSWCPSKSLWSGGFVAGLVTAGQCFGKSLWSGGFVSGLVTAGQCFGKSGKVQRFCDWAGDLQFKSLVGHMGTRGMPAGWLIGCFYRCLQLIIMMIIKYNNNDNNESNNNNNNNNDCVEKHISRFFTISSLRREHVHSCGPGAMMCK